MEYYNNDYLIHYGVKGMKWGVRRARNLQSMAAGSRQSAKEETELSNYYRSKGKTRAADRRARWAAEASADAAKYQKKADKIMEKQAAKEAKKEAANTPEAKAAKRKEAAKIGAAVVGTALASYGVYKVSQAIKDKNFKNAMDKGMKVLDKAASNGRLDDCMEMLKETIDMSYNAKVSDIVKRTIANNSVNGKVDWDSIRKIYK